MKIFNTHNSSIKIFSIHWGFSLGGVGKYSLLIEGVSDHGPISINSICILSKKWQCDEKGLDKLRARKLYIKSRVDFSWIRQVCSLINKIKPDAIISHGFNGHFVALLTKKISGHHIPVICSYHGLYHATTRIRSLFEKIVNPFTEYFIRSHAVTAISVAEYSKKYLVKKKIPSSKITVIHNGIEVVEPQQGARDLLRQEWGVDNDTTIIGAASRLDPVKGLTYLISAYEKLIKTHKNIFLVIVGTGTSEDDLKMQAEKSGLSDRVFFAGFRNDIIDCLEAFDIFVLPSLAEYHSIGLLEAMCASKAIVATDVGGNTESVRHEKEGLIVAPADAYGLHEAIKKYLVAPELGCHLSKKAKERFDKHFTIDVMVKKTAKWMIENISAL